MGIPIKPRKKYIILLLITLLLAIATYVIYVYGKTKTIFPYSVNKYSDTLNWCEPNAEDGKLNIDCKGLLLSIEPKDDESSCFNVQIITGTKELKDLSICEDTDDIKYTNELAGYKMFMPIDIVFSFTQGALNNFIFNGVSFLPVDSSYIQNIVNNDIAEISSLDLNSTTIKNSVDFCPSPKSLPKYIIENNTNAYSNFYNDNLMMTDSYKIPVLTSDAENSTIDKLLTCQSCSMRNLKNICNVQPNSSKFPSNITKLSLDNGHINWQNDLDEANTKELNTASMLLDGMYNKYYNVVELSYTFNTFVQNMAALENPNQKVICIAYQLYNVLNKEKGNLSSSIEYIQNILLSNNKNVSSSLCLPILSEISNVDKEGMYLKTLFSNQASSNFTIFERCNNLYLYLQ